MRRLYVRGQSGYLARRERGFTVAELEDDFDPKKRVQELIWSWAQRLLVLGVVLGAGYFWSYLTYGQGPDGAPALRSTVIGLKADVDRITKEKEDLRSKFEVVSPRLDELGRSMSLSLDEWTLLSRCEEPATLATLCESSPMKDFDVCRLVWAFNVVGILHRVA